MQVSDTQNTVAIVGFHALSDSLRLKIVELLQQQELCVCDLCDRLNVSQSKLSFHLKTLKQAGLISPRQSGRWIYYRLNTSRFALLEKYLTNIRQNTLPLSRLDCD